VAWASQLQHAVEGVDGDRHLGHPARICMRAHPPPAFHVLRTRNLDRLRPSPITCFHLFMLASTRARLLYPDRFCQATRPCLAMSRRWQSRCVGSLSAVSLGTAVPHGGTITAASGWRSATPA